MGESANNRSGGCACGAIRYKAQNVQPIWYCHCRQCRNITGHYMAASQVSLDDIEIQGEPKWYYVSEKSRHGFCPDCGSQIFWRNDTNPYMSITGGSMDDSSDLPDRGHIFVSEKGDYYQVPGNEKQCGKWDDPIN